MIVIGDVHGCLKTLKALIAKLPPDKEKLCVGDLIDRGPDSCGVVNFIRENGYKCILGNHEHMAIESEYDEYILRVWLNNGGGTTIQSFGDHGQDLHEFIEWAKTLPVSYTYKNFVITHSTCNKVWNLREKDPAKFKDYVLWNRDFNFKNKMSDMINIIGHTPVNDVVFRVNPDDPEQCNYIIVDTGCVFDNKLSALDLDTMEVYTQEKID